MAKDKYIGVSQEAGGDKMWKAGDKAYKDAQSRKPVSEQKKSK